MDSSPLPFTAQQWNRTMKQGSLPVLVLSIRRPVFPKNEKTARIERYFAQLAKQWRNRWETILFPKACQAKDAAQKRGVDFPPWQAKLDFAVTFWKPPLISLRFWAEESTEGDHPFSVCGGETWDCATGYPRTLRSFFPPRDLRWRGKVLQTIHDQAAERLSSGESLLDADCSQVIDRAFDPEHYYLTDEGAAVFYPLYTLGPYAEGVPVFTIPLPDIQAKGFSSESQTATR